MSTIAMEDSEIKNVYLKAVENLARGGRVTQSGSQFINEIDKIFEVTGFEDLQFQGVVATIAIERHGEKPTDEELDSVATSLRSFLKTAGSPYDTWKENRRLMIKKRQ